MYNIICITNRKLCRDDFLERIKKIAAQNPKAIILREKDLKENEYELLASRVLNLCEISGTKCILHTYAGIAEKLGVDAIHLPLPILRDLMPEQKEKFTILGTSCHSVEDAIEAEELGCTYIIAGHIYETDCKKGLAGRGTDFLCKVCENVTIPVYAIGGVSPNNISEVTAAGAKAGCVMSGLMQCENVEEYFHIWCGALR